MPASGLLLVHRSTADNLENELRGELRYSAGIIEGVGLTVKPCKECKGGEGKNLQDVKSTLNELSFSLRIFALISGGSLSFADSLFTIRLWGRFCNRCWGLLAC